MSGRPSVSVIVPFAGSRQQLDGLRCRLAALELGPRDELLVADNRRDAAADCVETGAAVRVLPAVGTACPGFARNRAARAARGDWLVFIDADTWPMPGLVQRYFNPPPGTDTGILAGGILDRPGGDGVAARASARRGHMSQRVTLDRAGTPYAQTANCAVRRAAFEAVGGFDEQARCGEDADLCFRLAALGWALGGAAGGVGRASDAGDAAGYARAAGPPRQRRRLAAPPLPGRVCSAVGAPADRPARP